MGHEDSPSTFQRELRFDGLKARFLGVLWVQSRATLAITLDKMCYQLSELYSACRCLYYQHSVDRCAKHQDSSHTITHRIILVGYACEVHNSVLAVGEGLDFEFLYFSRAAALSHSGRPTVARFRMYTGGNDR